MSTFAPLSPYFVKNIILSALQNLPAAALDKLAAFPKTKCSLSSIKGVLIDESNRNCQTDRRPWPRCHSQGDPPHHENPRGRPVTDNIGTVGKILLRHAGSVKKMGTGLYIVTEVEGATVGIREGWNGGKWPRNTRRLDAARQAFLLFTSINPPDTLRPFYDHRAFACTFWWSFIRCAGMLKMLKLM